MQTRMQQAAQSQAAMNTGKVYNASHYIKKQKEAQVVRIESMENTISMNLPAIVPNFQQLGDMNGDSSNDIFYQIKSFRCRNKFLNIKDTDRVVISTFIQFTRLDYLITGNGTATYDRDGLAANQELEYPIILNQVVPNYVLTADEIVNNLTDSVFETIWIGPATTNNDLNLANLLDYGGFEVKDGKLHFNYNYLLNKNNKPGEVRQDNYPIPLPAGDLVVANNDYFMINSVTIIVKIPLRLPETDQIRLAQVFGMQQQSDTGQYSLSLTLYPNQTQSTILRASPHYAAINPLMLGNLINPPYNFETTGGPMYVFPFDKIYVRSNLQSNMWTRTGKKTNVIAVIPMLGSQDSLAIEYSSSGSSSRVYNIRDSLNSIQHLQLFFTDQFGEPITFLEMYELEIAIFFQPSDPLVATL